MNEKDIYVLVNIAHCSARESLQGVLTYAAQRPDWRLHICNLPDNGAELVCAALENDVVAPGVELVRRARIHPPQHFGSAHR